MNEPNFKLQQQCEKLKLRNKTDCRECSNSCDYHKNEVTGDYLLCKISDDYVAESGFDLKCKAFKPKHPDPSIQRAEEQIEEMKEAIICNYCEKPINDVQFVKDNVKSGYCHFNCIIDSETIETTPTGGKQAKEPYNYDLIPREALHLICLNMTKGAEVYGRENYLDLKISDNASRAEAHMRFATMTEDERNRYSDEDILTHLVHGATRALFALDCYLRGRVG